MDKINQTIIMEKQPEKIDLQGNKYIEIDVNTGSNKRDLYKLIMSGSARESSIFISSKGNLVGKGGGGLLCKKLENPLKEIDSY